MQFLIGVLTSLIGEGVVLLFFERRGGLSGCLTSFEVMCLPPIGVSEDEGP